MVEDKILSRFRSLRDELACMGNVRERCRKKVAAIQCKLEKMERKKLKMEGEVFKRIPGEFIVALVNEIKKAVQYYEYMQDLRSRDFIKRRGNFDEILTKLVKEQEVIEESRRVPKEVIADTLDVRMYELRNVGVWKAHQEKYREYLKDEGVENAESLLQLIFPDINDVKAEINQVQVSLSLLLCSFKCTPKLHNNDGQSDVAMLTGFIMLTWKTVGYRQEYIMHPDPKVELLKIMKSDSTFYHEHFIVGKSPIEENLVAKALEEYSRFYSKYVESANGAETDASIMHECTKAKALDEDQFTHYTMSVEELDVTIERPFPSVGAAIKYAEERGLSVIRRKNKKRKYWRS